MDDSADMPASAHMLDALFEQIEGRKGGDPKLSYTAKLLQAGPHKCAKKLGEEAVEAALAAVDDDSDREHFVLECADVLYHLLVLMAACDVTPAEVYKELDARRGRSGLDEKSGRKSS